MLLIAVLFTVILCDTVIAFEQHEKDDDYYYASPDWNRQKMRWKREDATSYLKGSRRYEFDGRSKRIFPAWSLQKTSIGQVLNLDTRKRPGA